MATLETTIVLPLTLTEDGTIRITGTRVSLDSVAHEYDQGATPEEIAVSFPSLRIEDIYAAITYYLNHREQVEEYLASKKWMPRRFVAELNPLRIINGRCRTCALEY